MFNNSENFDVKKIQCNRFCFILVQVRVILRFLVCIKNFRQYKKMPWDKFVKKKRTFSKTFRSMRIFLELHCLFDDLVGFLEL